MSKPIFHAQSSARKYGGKWEDYIDIHNFMDSSKGAIADNRHRALTHNSWFLSVVLERVFGVARYNSAGDQYSVRDIGEQHVLEDFGMKFIPSAQDYLQFIDFQDWMNNGSVGKPPSREEVQKVSKKPIERPMVFDGSLKYVSNVEKVDTLVAAAKKVLSPKSSSAKPRTFD